MNNDKIDKIDKTLDNMSAKLDKIEALLNKKMEEQSKRDLAKSILQDYDRENKINNLFSK